MQVKRVVRQFLTRGGTRVEHSVLQTAATTSVVIDPVEPDTEYGVLVTPNWLTTCRVTSKTVNGFTVDFGTAAPADAAIDYLVFREG